MSDNKTKNKEKYPLVIEFSSPEARLWFSSWLFGTEEKHGEGEQMYWDWMEQVEKTEKSKSLTALTFVFNEATNIVKTVCGRMRK